MALPRSKKKRMRTFLTVLIWSPTIGYFLKAQISAEYHVSTYLLFRVLTCDVEHDDAISQVTDRNTCSE